MITQRSANQRKGHKTTVRSDPWRDVGKGEGHGDAGHKERVVSVTGPWQVEVV